MTVRYLFRANMIPIVIGLFFVSFGTAIFGTFVQWNWSLNSYGVWAFWGGVALALGLGLTGFDAILAYITPPLVTASGSNPQGDWNPMDVVLHSSPVNPQVIAKMAPGEMAVPSYNVGLDAKGRKVPVQVVPLGGRNGYGIHIGSGGLGYLILRGNQTMSVGDAHRDQYHFSPRVFRTLHISEVEEEVIDVLRRHRKFVYGKSPLYELGTHCKGFIEYIWSNVEDIQEILALPHGETPIGQPDAVYFQGRYHAVLTENATLRYERRHYLDTIQSQAEGLSGGARRQARVLRSSEPKEPSWEEANRRPQDEVR